MKHFLPHKGLALVLLRLALIVAIFGVARLAAAQTYEYRGNILYEKYSVQTPYTYYYYGRPYTYYTTTYQYKPVVNYSTPNWRQQVLNLIDNQKERESYDNALSVLGVQNLLAPKAGFAVQAQAAYNYPSAVGNTLGGFTSLSYARYGDVNALDINKASERAQAGADQVTRMATEISSIASGTAQQAAGLQQLNLERVGAIAELQEMRAAYREMGAALRDQTLAQAELMKTLKPQASESFSAQTGASATVGKGAELGSGFPPGSAPPPPQPPGATVTAEMAGVMKEFCAACHGRNQSAPAGNFYFDPSTPITASQFGSLALRMDPQAPKYRADGKTPYVMPPPDSPQPSLEQRRLLVDAGKLLVRED